MRRILLVALLWHAADARPQTDDKPALKVDVTKVAQCPDQAKAANGDKVTVHYGGFLADGKKFDSSFDRQKPFTFELGVGQVIPGWDQGLVGVCPGEERHLVVPAPLAYGDRGAGDVIPPHATLLFDIVVVDVEKKVDAAAVAAAAAAAEEEEERKRLQQEQAEAEERRRKEQERLVQQQRLEEEEAARKQQQQRQQQQQQQQQQQEAAAARPDYEEDYPTSGSGVGGCPESELTMRVTEQPATCARKAKLGDKLTMHYTGSLLDTGKKFDSSLDRAKPFDFTLGVGQVIQGWDQGVLGMCVGEKRRLTVPPSMAYGEAGVGDVIPPCASLVFDVQLLDIV